MARKKQKFSRYDVADYLKSEEDLASASLFHGETAGRPRRARRRNDPTRIFGSVMLRRRFPRDERHAALCAW
jgi:hypothetical protein